MRSEATKDFKFIRWNIIFRITFFFAFISVIALFGSDFDKVIFFVAMRDISLIILTFAHIRKSDLYSITAISPKKIISFEKIEFESFLMQKRDIFQHLELSLST